MHVLSSGINKDKRGLAVPATAKKQRGRPRKPDSEKRRNNVTFRMKDDIKRRLQEAANSQGTSLSEETENRVELTFLGEEAYGGKELNGLLLLMVGATKIIQERNGKSASDDWETGLAAHHAWKRQIRGWLPRPPDEWIAEVEWRSSAVSNPPERPKEPIRGGLLAPRAPEEEFEVFRERLQKFHKDQESFLIGYDEHEAALRKMQDEVKKAAGIGKEALDLLRDPRREAVIQTAIPAQRVEKTKEK